MVRVWLPYADVDEAAARLGGLPAGLEVDCFRGDGDDLPASAAEVEVVVLPYMKPGGAAVLAGLPSLRTVQTLTAGVDDVLPHLGPDVTLCNAAGVHDASTAELAVGLALAALRHLPDFVVAQRDSQWLPERVYPALADRRVLVLGYGNIGRAVVRRLLPFEVSVSPSRGSRTATVAPVSRARVSASAGSTSVSL